MIYPCLVDINEMAQVRTESTIINSGMNDNTSKRNSRKLTEQSSPSSIEGTSVKNIDFDRRTTTTSSTTTTASTTTTDSDFESETDDNSQSKRQKTDKELQEQKSRAIKKFHKLFKSEIDEKMPNLIDTYVCAYQGDILLQGKLYITDHYLCFYSCIIAYVTKHVYRWEQIGNVTKERVAYIFPTAIGIQLKSSGKRIIYASFLQRDQAYDKIISIWSKYSNGMNSFDDDDDESYLTQDGTLKATNSNSNNPMKSFDNRTYEIIDGPEQEEVLHMCLKNKKRRIHSVSSKSSDENFQMTKTIKNTKPSKKLTNGQTNGVLRSTNPENKQIDTVTLNKVLVNTNSSSPQHPTSSDSRAIESSTENEDSSLMKSNKHGLKIKVSNALISFLNLFIEYISSFIQHIKTYPIKIPIIIIIIVIVICLHTFYLIKLAYRIENRLQSIHRIQSPTSSIKYSLSSSNTKEL